MQAKKRSALLLGATGLVGNQCLKQLLEDDNYERVNVISRRAITNFKNEKLSCFLSDFSNLDEVDQAFSVQDVYCFLSASLSLVKDKAAYRHIDVNYPLAAAKLAVKHNADQFLIVTALLASPKSPIFSVRTKGELEQALVKLDLKGLHIFQPSMIYGDRGEFRLGEKAAILVFRTMKPLLVGPLKRGRAIRNSTVASVMIAKAKEALPGIHKLESDKIQAYYDNRYVI